MSIDLDWRSLSSLSSILVERLNRQLEQADSNNSSKPSFLGPITVQSFDFGQITPDVEIVDVCDIYRDFLVEDEEESEGKPEETRREKEKTDDGYEWVSRRGSGTAGLVAESGLAYHYLPPHVRYAAPGPSLGTHAGYDARASPFGSSPGSVLPSRTWGTTSLPNIRTVSSMSMLTPGFHLHDPRHFDDETRGSFYLDGDHHDSPHFPESRDSLNYSQQDITHPPNSPIPPIPEEPPVDTMNDLQFHLRIHHHSDVRISIQTSLLINYPSPLFMSLPMTLTVVGLDFDGELVVAYQASKKRIHLCVLDDLDPYGPKPPVTPPEPAPADHQHHTSEYADGSTWYSSKQLENAGDVSSPGQRILPNIFIESEIGQTDKHVLRNVSRLETFIQDMIRKTLEEELVWPNFLTVDIGEQQPDS